MTPIETFIYYFLLPVMTGVLGYLLGRIQAFGTACETIYKKARHYDEEYVSALTSHCSIQEESFHRGKWKAAHSIYVAVATSGGVKLPSISEEDEA